MFWNCLKSKHVRDDTVVQSKEINHVGETPRSASEEHDDRLLRELQSMMLWAPRCTLYRTFREVGFIRYTQRLGINVKAVVFKSLGNKVLDPTNHPVHTGLVYELPDTSNGPSGTCVVVSDSQTIIVILTKKESDLVALFGKDVNGFMKWIEDRRLPRMMHQERFTYPGTRNQVKNMEFIAEWIGSTLF